MCRYASHTYKSHFACFDCRKVFKKTPLEDYVGHVGLAMAYKRIIDVYPTKTRLRAVEAELGMRYEDIEARYLEEVSVCPQCGGRMVTMGRDFKAPRRSDTDAWRIVQALREHGFAFMGCGCSVGYAPPSRLAELPAWLAQRQRVSEGEALLRAIDGKRTRA